MFKSDAIFIRLDKQYNIVGFHNDVAGLYPVFLENEFFRNLLSGYDFSEFAQPLSINLPFPNINNITLIVVQDGDELMCYPVKSQVYKDSSRNINYRMREPISSIFSILPILTDNIENNRDEMTSSNLENINLQAYKLLKNVNNITLVSRILSGDMPAKNTFDFSVLLENLIMSVKAVEKNIMINSDIDRNIFINVNKNFITTAFLNLVANSINYKSDDTVKITVSLKKSEKGAVFSYWDNSKGVKEEYLPMIFKPYFSKDPYADGESDPAIGLGLFIVKNAFESAGGKIFVTSVFGEGIKYSISLPVTKPENDVMESRATDFLLNRYSELFVQLCDSCDLPPLK